MKTVMAALVVLVLFVPSVSFAQLTWCLDLDEIRASVQDGAILITHQVAEYNCCPDSFTYEVAQEGGILRVTERENLTLPCYCFCCYDLGVMIHGMAPGDYEIHFSWYDYEYWIWRTELRTVTIPEDLPPGPRPILETFASACLDAQSVPEPGDPDEPPAGTWGRIKSLFHRGE